MSIYTKQFILLLASHHLQYMFLAAILRDWGRSTAVVPHQENIHYNVLRLPALHH